MSHFVATVLKSKGFEVTKVEPSTPVSECLKMMKEQNIGSVVVMENDKVVGMFTERVAVRSIYLDNCNLDQIPVSQVMTDDLCFAAPDTTVEAVMSMFTERRLRQIPVMEDEKLVGIISIGDVTKWIIDQQGFEIEHLSNYISGP